MIQLDTVPILFSCEMAVYTRPKRHEIFQKSSLPCQTTPLTPAQTQPPHALAKYTQSLGYTPLLPSPKSVRLWSVFRYPKVGVSLVPLFDPLFKRFRLHCFNVCLTWNLWHMKTWWQYLVPTYRIIKAIIINTAPRYATIPKLICGMPPYPNWSVDMSCLLR